jgi:hypothetical protein
MTEPYPITYSTQGGVQYEYTRRLLTLEDPVDLLDLIVRRLYVTDGFSADTISANVGEFAQLVEIAGSYNSNNGGFCSLDLDNLRLYVGGDTVIEEDLLVRGDCCIEGTLSKASGSFDIKHPVEEEKRLRHSFVESPRYDNIYRNKVRLTKGKATVNLDTDCVSPGGQTMTPGTWEKLNRNPDIFLQNLEGWSRLKGKITGSTLEIKCEDENCMDLVSWMVVAERQDEHVMNSGMSDDEGRLILEYDA